MEDVLHLNIVENVLIRHAQEGNYSELMKLAKLALESDSEKDFMKIMNAYDIGVFAIFTFEQAKHPWVQKCISYRANYARWLSLEDSNMPIYN